MYLRPYYINICCILRWIFGQICNRRIFPLLTQLKACAGQTTREAPAKNVVFYDGLSGQNLQVVEYFDVFTRLKLAQGKPQAKLQRKSTQASKRAEFLGIEVKATNALGGLGVPQCTPASSRSWSFRGSMVFSTPSTIRPPLILPREFDRRQNCSGMHHHISDHDRERYCLG
jgi:hypothetical protein